jgi:hydrogenase/urease accessory protein HupE
MIKKHLFYLLLLFVPLYVDAHEFNPAHLVVKEIKTNSYEAEWMYPVKNIGARGEVYFPDSCKRETKQIEKKGKYLVESIGLICDSTLKGKSVEVVNLSVLTDALITFVELDGTTFEGIMNAKSPIIDIPLEKQIYPTAYFNLGVDHLLEGNDHILFIFGLLFLVSNLMAAVKTITAFTVAHSITLGLSVFSIISIPQATVEALIALTIVYLAYEVSEKKKYTNTPWLIAFGFGLLHGLGFANVLDGIGIANDQLVTSLLFFNIGIEAGQLLLIPLFSLLIWVSFKIKQNNRFATVSSYFLGGIGSYWFIDRMAGIIY